MRPTVAVVAADEPEIAANSVQPSTLTCSSRPGRRVVQGVMPANSVSESRVRNRISAIRMNIGSASSSGVVVTFQIIWASSFSTGMDRKTPSEISPTENRETATHTPAASVTASRPRTVKTMVVVMDAPAPYSTL